MYDSKGKKKTSSR